MRGTPIAACAAAAVLLVPGAAQADHRHVLVTGNGDCVILAKNGKEPFVTLPGASFKNTSEPTPTTNPHPLHVHVHRARPGEVNTIAVYGSPADPCRITRDYLNAP